MDKPRLFLIGGPNGAGKTTSAMSLLPGLLTCDEYINADIIAAGISPFHPEVVSLQAGRLMVKRIHELARARKDFAFETTLASRSFASFLRKCKARGYRVTVLYFYLESVELAIRRVKERAAAGGHSVPPEDIRRRYWTGMRNLTRLYLPLADHWLAFDNSGEQPIQVARKLGGGPAIMYNEAVWKLIREAGKNGV